MQLHSARRDDICIPTHSGRQLCLSAPDSSQIGIEDIAHGLAYQCCLNGQTSHFYSLAQHSIMVAHLVPPRHRLAALLHDAVAAYLGDLAGVMRQLSPEYPSIEKKLMAAVGEKFSVSGFDAPAIERAHQIVEATELRDLQACPIAPGGAQNHAAPVPRRIEFMGPEEAKYQFLELFTEIVACPPLKPVRVAASETLPPREGNRVWQVRWIDGARV